MYQARKKTKEDKIFKFIDYGNYIRLSCFLIVTVTMDHKYFDIRVLRIYFVHRKVSVMLLAGTAIPIKDPDDYNNSQKVNSDSQMMFLGHQTKIDGLNKI